MASAGASFDFSSERRSTFNELRLCRPIKLYNNYYIIISDGVIVIEIFEIWHSINSTCRDRDDKSIVTI